MRDEDSNINIIFHQFQYKNGLFLFRNYTKFDL